jgi:acyl-homoserine lactone acylase PvdQ
VEVVVRRLATVLVTSAVVGAALSAPATAAPAGGGAAGEYPGVRNILPPGQSGSINATEAAQVTAGDPQNRVAVDRKNAPPNFANQLEMYDALNHADLGKLTDGQLASFYKNAPLTLRDQDAVRTDRPKSGVVIRWDSFGVPYIEGRTREDAAFGSGYAGTKDRMFLMDLLRHVGAARAAEFLGPSEANVEMDQEQLRSAFYTPEEAAAQIDQAAVRFGDEGKRLVAALDAYIAGINAAQEEMCPAVVAGPDCPVEYAALQKKPEPWTRADVVYVASLVGGIFGKGGGAEFANARWFAQLQARFGTDEAKRVFDDLALADDPQAPTTSSTPASYGSGPVDPSKPGVAMPDLDGPTAPGTGADAGSGGIPDPGLASLAGRFGTQEKPTVVQGPFGPIDLGGVPDMMSNAALVAGSRSTDGHPRVVFGPQTGYFTPQLLTEQAVVAPGIRARGVSFAGTSMVVQLGRGVDYAWSATSAGSDLVDTVVERLCDPAGGAATVRSEGYLVGSTCTPMDEQVHEETAVPNASSPGAPQTYRFLVLRTGHGIVQLRTTVQGRPVAVVLQRSTYGRELDSALGFERLGNPDYVKDAATFRNAASAIDFTFNWFYVDDRDIAYYSSGRLPVRAPGVDGHLPRWGDAAYDWQGWLPTDAHPQQVNPPSGYLVSWNNKQAPGFTAADDQWGYGPVHRSLAISDRLKALAAKGGVTTTDVVAAVEDAATVDSRAFYTLPPLLDVIGTDDPQLADAVALLRGWQQRGAHRIDHDRNGSYEDQAAIALFDAWWSGVDEQGVGQDLLKGSLGDLVAALPQRHDDHPRQGLGSSWNGVAWYGYVLKDLAEVRGTDPGAWSKAYCGGGDLTTCQADLRASLKAAVDRVLAEQGVSTVRDLTYDKHIDDIRSTTAGLVGVRPIDWQNRPTFQQVVAYTGHRRRS